MKTDIEFEKEVNRRFKICLDRSIKETKVHFKKDKWPLNFCFLVEQILVDTFPGLQSKVVHALFENFTYEVDKDGKFVLTAVRKAKKNLSCGK